MRMRASHSYASEVHVRKRDRKNRSFALDGIGPMQSENE